jgi:hypothetical protein
VWQTGFQQRRAAMIEETETYSLNLNRYGLYVVRVGSTVSYFEGLGVAYAWLASEGLL